MITKTRIRPDLDLTEFSTVEGSTLWVSRDVDGTLEIDFGKPRRTRSLTVEEVERLAEFLKDAIQTLPGKT